MAMMNLTLLYIRICFLYIRICSPVLGLLFFWFEMDTLVVHIAQPAAALDMYLLKVLCELCFRTSVEQCVLFFFVSIEDLYIWFVKILFILYYTYYIFEK